MKNILFLFDIDGTLLSAGGCGRIAIERIFLEEFGVSNAWGTLLPDGKTDCLIFNEIAERCLGRSLTPNEWTALSRLYALYYEQEAEAHSARFQPMPGTAILLERLSGMGHFHLAIATGNIEHVSWIKLRKTKLHTYFNCGGFGSHHTQRIAILNDALIASEKYFGRKFDPDFIFVIGDTKHDVSAAHALKFKSVGVDTGSNRGKDFEEVSPHHRLPDFLDSDAFLKIFA